MRSSDEILKYIDDFYNHALERPFMYASSPQSLEETLITLEKLREFIVSDRPDQCTEKTGYEAFLLNQGYGVSQFTSNYYPSRSLTDHDKRVFRDLSDFWKKYLAGRPTPEPNT
jgi:hypothetical protein